MSVLIKNMEMPKCCLECPFEDSPEFDSYCIAIGNDEFIGKWKDLGTYKPDWCPLEEPKTGKWVKKPHKVYLPRDREPTCMDNNYNENDHSVTEYWWHCSECDYEADEWMKPIFDYCPNCGADMRGEKNIER